jgi:geranylgeranylglycerol-phosphate geranylgeranyltransferase
VPLVLYFDRHHRESSIFVHRKYHYHMQRILPCIQILRPANALMTAIGVALGWWLCAAGPASIGMALLMVAAVCAVGFGNVVNDIRDVESDRVNHPTRPLPAGTMSLRTAWIFAGLLAGSAMVASLSVSPLHGTATVAPLALLALYARYLKATPLAGNLLVSLLVAYPIVYGGLGSGMRSHVVVPALLAFLLNLSREIVKDVQDRPGDLAQGAITTAVLPNRILRALLVGLAGAYVPLTLLPAYLGHFGAVYVGVCVVAVIPVHLAWLWFTLRPTWHLKLARISMLIKVEMVCGLVALAADRAIAG